MITNDGKNVRTCTGIVLWDGITQPERDDRTGATVHTMQVAIPANAQEFGELEQLAQNTLNASDFKGNLPPGGNWPLMEIDMSKYGDSASLLTGYKRFNAKTRAGVPQIFDANGKQLDATQFGQMLYPGAHVQVVVHAYAFNNVSKGIGFGLDGIMIIDHTAPKLDVGGGMSGADVAAAFGFGGGAPAQQPAATPPPAAGGQAPANDFAAGAGAATPPPPGAATPPPPAASGPRMTAKANGASYDSFIQQGWTDELLIQHGYMEQ